MSAAAVDPMLPLPARVLDVKKESADVFTLALEGGRRFEAGQFNMLYAFGVGEVPISMSGPPGRQELTLHTIKAVGAVTDALCELKKGDPLGVRGPFGTPWPMEAARGGDLLLVAGGLGLAPLRPVVYQVLERRADFGRVWLLVGARAPEELLFRRQLEAWEREGALTVRTTVDRASPSWKGRVGVVTSLLGELQALAPTTTAFVCGPEVMMRFTVRELERRGLTDARVFLSMERNMKCAVGFCGHCQLGPSFVCKDGPVLSYQRLRPLLWTREL